jgi:Protein of unknown function (DUF3039)
LIGAQVSTELEQWTDQETEAGAHDKFTHIVLEALETDDGELHPLDNSVVEGSVYGTPVRALCGYEFVPRSNPQRYPICPTCREIAERNGWNIPTS